MVHEHEDSSSHRINELKFEKKSRIKGFATAVAGGVIGSVLTFTTVPYFDLSNSKEKAVAVEEINTAEQATETMSVQQVSSTSFSVADIVAEASKAIVGITNIQEQNNPFGQGGFEQNGEEVESGTGSGVVYEATDNALYIVTNHHVIEDATSIEVTLYDEKVVEAELIGSDSLTDIAVLKIEGSYDIAPLGFGDSDVLRAGDEVIAIGNPLGLDLYGTVTQGIVSAVNRTIEVSTSAGIWEMEVIQTDAAINPGNSGGALINVSGELIGINSMKIAEDDVEGLGFAIPSNEVLSIIDELIANGQIVRPYLGISMVNLSEIPQYYLQNMNINSTTGVMIADIDENSAAKDAGLQVEDIVVSIDGTAISDADDMRKYLYTEASVGDVVKLVIYRQGEKMEISVTLSSNQLN
ncbi:S1C family serine protease [Ornithinibacillus xuwenensis]|uniref:Trypsin-like peptidase domain-containing protein n=1 Tax=Ornithinibacillus xuwenensis TaxID=3144668 RepID=A0ABU9XK65_9BACI